MVSRIIILHDLRFTMVRRFGAAMISGTFICNLHSSSQLKYVSDESVSLVITVRSHDVCDF